MTELETDACFVRKLRERDLYAKASHADAMCLEHQAVWQIYTYKTQHTESY